MSTTDVYTIAQTSQIRHVSNQSSLRVHFKLTRWAATNRKLLEDLMVGIAFYKILKEITVF